MLKGADSKKLWAYCDEMQYIPGYSLGVHVTREFSRRKIALRMEIKYTRRGTKAVYSYLGAPVIDKLILEYAEVPLLLYFTLHGNRDHRMYTGISIARLVGSRMKIDDLSGNPENVWFPLMKTDFLFTVGYRFNLGDHFYAVLGFTISMDTIVPKYAVYNQSLSINLNYDF